MGDAGKKKHHQLMWTHYEIRFHNKYLFIFVEQLVFDHAFAHRRTGDERSTTLDVVNDRQAYPPLIFSRVKSYTLAAEQPLK